MNVGLPGGRSVLNSRERMRGRGVRRRTERRAAHVAAGTERISPKSRRLSRALRQYGTRLSAGCEDGVAFTGCSDCASGAGSPSMQTLRRPGRFLDGLVARGQRSRTGAAVPLLCA